MADFSEILNKELTDLVKAERELLNEINANLTNFGAHENDRALLAQLVEGLDELFLLVVVGEFNSGKSAFINALIGRQVLAEGVTPTTSSINILRYSPQPGQRLRDNDILEVFYPAPFLRDISLVDTPGTNAVIERHQELTEHFVPRSDLVLFVTSAERPFTQSEREFLTRVRDWGKKIVVIVNKIDLVPDSAQREQVLRFVHEQFLRLLQLEPAIFPVSGRLAQQAKAAGSSADPGLWQASGFGALENFIFRTLDQQSRLKLKLLNPLQVGRKILDYYNNLIGERLSLLEQDARTISDIERQLEIYTGDLRNDFNGRLALVNNLIYELNERGERFFDSVLKLTNAWELVRTDKIKQEFEAQVVGDIPKRIENAVQELIDWLVERDLRLWQDITNYLNQRRQAGTEGLLSSGGGLETFNANRQALLRQVTQQVRSVVETYDQRREAAELTQTTRQAIARSFLTEVGAIGIGAALAAIIGTAAADVTGILFAVVIGTLGLYLLPARRRKAKAEFRRKIEDLRLRLTSVLQDQFDAEQRRSVDGVHNAISPYSRFVRAEQSRLGDFSNGFTQCSVKTAQFENQIEQVLAKSKLPPPPVFEEYTALPALPASSSSAQTNSSNNLPKMPPYSASPGIKPAELDDPFPPIWS